MKEIIVNNPLVVPTILLIISTFYILISKKKKWKIFILIPAHIWVLITSVFFNQINILPRQHLFYNTFLSFHIPIAILLMLLDIDIKHSFKLTLSSVKVFFFGIMGLVFGAIISYIIMHNYLPNCYTIPTMVAPAIGGFTNLFVIAESSEVSSSLIGTIMTVNTFVFILYFSFLLICKRWQKPFNKYSHASEVHMENIKKLNFHIKSKNKKTSFEDILTLITFSFLIILISKWIVTYIPIVPPFLTSKANFYIIITSFGIMFSFTKLSNISGTKIISSLAIVLSISIIGARIELKNLDQAYIFIVIASILIFFHVMFLVIASRLFKVDLSIAVIASISSLGGVVTAPIIASFYDEELVPVSILLGLIGNFIANYICWFIVYFLCNIV